MCIFVTLHYFYMTITRKSNENNNNFKKKNRINKQEKLSQVSADCSTLFVDGSESAQGSNCATVEFTLGTLHSVACLQVWAPTVPLRVLLSDPVLNAIDGWNHFTESG